MKKIMTTLLILTSLPSLSNENTNISKKNTCIINSISCIGCEQDLTIIERTKDALIKRNYQFDEEDSSGTKLKIEYNQYVQKNTQRLQSICPQMEVHPGEGWTGTAKLLLGLNFVRGCSISKKQEDETYSYKKGGKNFHKVEFETSAHSEGFITAKSIRKYDALSESFDKMLRRMDVEDCI